MLIRCPLRGGFELFSKNWLPAREAEYFLALIFRVVNPSSTSELPFAPLGATFPFLSFSRYAISEFSALSSSFEQTRNARRAMPQERAVVARTDSLRPGVPGTRLWIQLRSEAGQQPLRKQSPFDFADLAALWQKRELVVYALVCSSVVPATHRCDASRDSNNNKTGRLQVIAPATHRARS